MPGLFDGMISLSCHCKEVTGHGENRAHMAEYMISRHQLQMASGDRTSLTPVSLAIEAIETVIVSNKSCPPGVMSETIANAFRHKTLNTNAMISPWRCTSYRPDLSTVRISVPRPCIAAVVTVIVYTLGWALHENDVPGVWPAVAALRSMSVISHTFGLRLSSLNNIHDSCHRLGHYFLPPRPSSYMQRTVSC